MVASNNGRRRAGQPAGVAGHHLAQRLPPVRGLAANDTRLATCSVDARLRIWDWDGRPVSRSETSRIEYMAFAPAGRPW